MISTSNGKITINWEDLRSRQVEQRLCAMQAVNRNREYAQLTDAAPEPWKEFISSVLVFGVSRMLIASALSMAESVVSRNFPLAIVSGSIGATIGIVGGIVVALFAERMHRLLGGSDGSITSAHQIL